MKRNEPTVTEVQIHSIKPVNGLIAFASCVLNNCIYLSSIGIHSKLDGTGYRLTYATKLVAGRQINIFHPINTQTSKAIEEAVIAKLKEVMKGSEYYGNAESI